MTEKSTKDMPNARTGRAISRLGRINSLDYLRGIAIFNITWGHMALYWKDASWLSLFALSDMILDWMGPCLFIAVTAIGTMISIKQKQVQGKTEGMFKNALRKSIYLFVVGEILNIIIEANNANKVGIWHVLGMNMITAIAFSQLIMFGLAKLRRNQKFALLVGLLILYPVLLVYVLAGVKYDYGGTIAVTAESLTQLPYIIYYLMFHMDAMAPTFLWLITSVLTSLVFGEFVDSYVKLTGTRETDIARFKVRMREHAYVVSKLANYGLILAVFSFLFGGFILARGIGFSFDMNSYMNNPDVFRIYYLDGLPLVLVRNFVYCTVFNAGIFTLFFAFSYRRECVQQKKLWLQAPLTTLGQFSFSMFIIGHIFMVIPLRVPYPVYLLIALPLTFAYCAAIIIWAAKGKGIGTLEWGLTMYVRVLDYASARFGTRGKKSPAKGTDAA
nr:hypothetical protein [Candidatus Sigynarchaeota archaeon]